MKKIIFGLSVLMSIVGTTDSFGFTNKNQSNNHRTVTVVRHHTQSPTYMTGGYTQQRSLTKQDKQLFKNTYKGKEKLTPVSVGTQVVNGTNYKFVCKDKHGRQVTVIIYQTLPHQGSKAEVVSVNR